MSKLSFTLIILFCCPNWAKYNLCNFLEIGYSFSNTSDTLIVLLIQYPAAKQTILFVRDY